MKSKQQAEAAPVSGQQMCDALRFAPLRVAQDSEHSWGVWTREDCTPGTLNNFELAQCQFENDARLFASAPALLEALRNTLNELEHWHGWRLHESPSYADSGGFRVCQGRIDRARAAIAAAEGRVS